MAAYTLPRATFDLLIEALGEKEKAEIFAKAIEEAIEAIDTEAKEGIVEKKSQIKTELRDELRRELVTRELFEERFKALETEMNGRFKALETEIDGRFKKLEIEINEGFNVVDERFNVVDEKFNSLNFKMNIFIAIALIALTFANPTFIQLIERIFGF